jgi:kinesin family member 11
MFTANTKVVLTHGKTVATEAQKFWVQLDGYTKSTNSSLTKLRADAEQYQAKELETLAACSGRIGEQIQRVQESLQVIQAKDDVSSEAVGIIHTAIKQAHDSIITSFSSWSEKFQLSSTSMFKEIEKASLSSCQTVCSFSMSCFFSLTWIVGGKGVERHVCPC